MQIWGNVLISENDTDFEVCPFGQSSVRLWASLTADITDQRKHLAVHLRCVVSTRHSGNLATEQLMDMEPKSCTKHHSLVFKGCTALKNTLKTADSMVVACLIAINFFPRKNRMNQVLHGIDQLPGGLF